MGDALYGEVDPTGLSHPGPPQEVFKVKGASQLRLPLPFIEKSDIKLTRSMHDELIVHIGNWKPNIALPRVLTGLPVQGPRHEESDLVILFKSQEAEKGDL